MYHLIIITIAVIFNIAITIASAVSIVAGITMVNMVNINIVIAIVTANTMATNHYQLQVDGRFSRLDLDARHHGGAHLCHQVGTLTNDKTNIKR